MKKNILFVSIISLTIAGLLALTSVLGIISFRKNYTQSVAQNNSIVLSGVVRKIEYSIRYGKSLKNFYGISDLFDEAVVLCPYITSAHISDLGGQAIYQMFYEHNQLSEVSENPSYDNEAEEIDGILYWTSDNEQHISMPIYDINRNTIAMFGISYDNRVLDANIEPYIELMLLYTLVSIAVGVLVFFLLFHVVKHKFRFKKLLIILIPIIIISNVILCLSSYFVYREGYTTLTRQLSQTVWIKIENDITSVSTKGVPYDEFNELEEYFDDLTSYIPQIERIFVGIQLENPGSDTVQTYVLPPDINNQTMTVITRASETYIEEKLNSIIVQIVVSGIMSLMIAAEIIVFILAILTSSGIRKRKEIIIKQGNESAQSTGIVRGIIFFFAMFQFMSLAFIPIVMKSIYRPMFGIPLTVMMGLPLTVQILMAIPSSWFGGKISGKIGWRPTALCGILLMTVGTSIAALASEPALFLAAMILIGLGLGFSRTSLDVYTVLSASKEKLEESVASCNAGMIVGLSCSAAIGAVIAEVLGFSGAFICMSGLGLFVMLMIALFADNIKQPTENKQGNAQKLSRKSYFRFIIYIAFMVIPYFFMSMFLDYYFPVYANTNGMTTSSIGHVFLIYGIATSYIGAYLCKFLSKRFKTVTMLSGLSIVLGVGMVAFALHESLVFAVAMVIIMAVADGIIPSLQYSHVYSLDITKSVGISRLVGAESAFISAIRGIAPLIFGVAMTYGSMGLLIIAAAIIVLPVIFLALSSIKSREPIA